MKIIGCDFHTRYQQMAMLDEATGELMERRLDHASGEAQAFYRELQGPVRVGAHQLLVEWIIMNGGSEAVAPEDFKVFREIRKERESPAHKIDSRYLNEQFSNSG
jgi:hypothetical protein